MISLPVGSDQANGQHRLRRNVWETEDGPSFKLLTVRDEWDQPLCWCQDHLLAVWGYGEGVHWASNGRLGRGEDPSLIPAVCLFDAPSGRDVRWFAGPRGLLFFDRYLFSCSSRIGTQVWDIATGERLHHDPTCRPTHYHPGARAFLTLLPDDTFRLSRLVEDANSLSPDAV